MKNPLLTPADSLEVLELLESVVACMRNTAHYAALRKELRLQLENQARECETMALKIRKVDTFDESLLNAIDALSAKTGRSFQALLREAMEAYISGVNKK